MCWVWTLDENCFLFFSLSFQRGSKIACRDSSRDKANCDGSKMEIHFIIQEYSDLFSKSDQRSIPYRSISRDFIDECKMRIEEEDNSQNRFNPGTFFLSQFTQRISFRRKKKDLESADAQSDVHVKLFMPTKHRERSTEMQVVDRYISFSQIIFLHEDFTTISIACSNDIERK